MTANGKGIGFGNWCRPYGTRFYFAFVPGTAVPGFPIPPLRGWGISSPLLRGNHVGSVRRLYLVLKDACTEIGRASCMERLQAQRESHRVCSLWAATKAQ